MITSIGLCFAFALLARALGYSVALGAFVAGSLIAESGRGKDVAHLVAPVRDRAGRITGVIQLLKKMMHPDPNRRFASVDDVLKAIDALTLS